MPKKVEYELEALDMQDDIEIAKRIICAIVSYRMGISYQTYWKNYIKDNDNFVVAGTKWVIVHGVSLNKI